MILPVQNIASVVNRAKIPAIPLVPVHLILKRHANVGKTIEHVQSFANVKKHAMVVPINHMLECHAHVGKAVLHVPKIANVDILAKIR